jgi:hypothetical protein
MPKQLVSPTRTAPSAVHLGPWAVEVAGELLPLPDMPAWDYSTELRFACEVGVDIDEAARSCGLVEGAAFSLVAIAECTATYWRTTVRNPLHRGSARVTLTVPPGVVAQSVRLSRRVVVEQAPCDPQPLVPTRGHVIAAAQDVTTVPLEGDGGRFPTQAISFSEAGFPVDAPWHLSLTYDDPEDSFAGSVQLFLNTDHKRIADMIGDDPDPDMLVEMHGHMAFDVARQLVMAAVRDDRLDSRTVFENDSVGWVLEGVCSRTGRRSAAGCRAAHAQDPNGFETELKGRLGFLT